MTTTPQGQVPEAIAGALFDFAGFLTTLPKERAVTLSGAHLATPVVDLLTEWAKTRGLNLDEANVKGWVAALTAAPTNTNTASGAATAQVLAYLDGLSDDAAAHIYPSDLEKCMTSECVVEVFSVRAGNGDERTVPLFSREQVVAALASTPAQPEPASLGDLMKDAQAHSRVKYKLATSRAAFQEGVFFAFKALRASRGQAPVGALEDAARYRWLAGHCRSTSEHWGGRWSIVVDGPAPKSHDSEDDFDAAIDAARKQGADHE